MTKFVIWVKTIKGAERRRNVCGSHWSRMWRFMAPDPEVLSKSWSQKKKVGTTLHLILHHSLKWCESVSLCFKSAKIEVQGREEFGVAGQLLRGAEAAWASPAGAGTEPPLLPPAPAQTWAEGMKSIPAALLGGWFTATPAFLTSIAAKQKGRKRAHSVTLVLL